MSTATKEQFLAALKKLGPSKPGVIADHLGVEYQNLKRAVREMLAAGEIKAIGKTAGRVLMLPDQKLEDRTGAPPQRRQKPKNRRKAKHARKARTAPAARSTERFIPTVDIDRRLVIVNGGDPVIFNGEQTLAIAELLFNHYDPK